MGLWDKSFRHIACVGVTVSVEAMACGRSRERLYNVVSDEEVGERRRREGYR